MAFSAFTLDKGVCSPSIADLFLPTCPLLTFDLALLHLLSTCSLTLLLVILSIALSPTYYLSLSRSLLPSGAGQNNLNPEAANAFIMWDLALASPPSSPHLGPNTTTPITQYGTSSTSNPLTASIHPRPEPSSSSTVQADSSAQSEPIRKRDKFADGRVWSYVPLGMCSLGVAVTAVSSLDVASTGIFTLGQGKYGENIMTSLTRLMRRVHSLGQYFHASSRCSQRDLRYCFVRPTISIPPRTT